MLVLASGCASEGTLDDESEPRSGLVGAWLIVETEVTTPSGTTTNENPQTGLYIFTERHFSNMLIPRESRPLFSEERTDEEKLVAYDNFIADSGSYELTDSLLTTHNMIAKVPNVTGPVFEPLRDVQTFRSFQVHPDLHTVTWPNGADFAPEFLHSLIRVPA